MLRLKDTGKLLQKTYENWNTHNATRLGASVAFYTLLSLAPLLVLTVAIAALAFGEKQAEGQLLFQANALIGPQGTRFVRGLIQHAQQPAHGAFASIVAVVTLLFGASGVFSELRDALNLIWDKQTKKSGALARIVKQRLFSFGMVLGVGFLLLVSLIASAIMAVIWAFFGEMFPFPPALLEAANFVISFAVTVFLFALILKLVPDVRLEWRHVLVGATATALLFTIGKSLLGIYLGRASVGSAYGAAGSLVAIIVWVYYSAQIFFFGAEFTRVYTELVCGYRASKPNQSPAPVGNLSRAAHP